MGEELSGIGVRLLSGFLGSSCFLLLPGMVIVLILTETKKRSVVPDPIGNHTNTTAQPKLVDDVTSEIEQASDAQNDVDPSETESPDDEH